MIYIVRHGETNWNVQNRYQGRTNIPLNENGYKQALEAHEKVKDVHFDVVISSPLDRALITASIISGFDKEDIIKDDRLLERAYGSWEGKKKNEIEELRMIKGAEDEAGVERLDDIKVRVKDFFDEITEKYKDKNVLVATHAVVTLFGRYYFEGEKDPKEAHKYILGNAEIISYETPKIKALKK